MFKMAEELQKQLQTEYKRMQEEKKKTRRSDNVGPRNLNIDNATDAPPAKIQVNNPPYVDNDDREVMATPRDNLQVAKKILDERQDPAAIA